MSGCGGEEGAIRSGEEGAIRDVMWGYFRAALEGDRAAACSFLTKADREASGEGCLVPNTEPGSLDGMSDAEKDAYLDANKKAVDKVKVTIDGDTAKAGSGWFFRKENGEWRLDGPEERAEEPTAPEYGRH